MVPPKDESLWSVVASRIISSVVTHPLEYAKVLIQIGHEPIPPWQTRRLFGQPALALPNVFQYIKYIKSVDGFTGCYRGLTPKLCAYTVNAIAYEKTSECIVFDDSHCPVEDENLSSWDRSKRLLQELVRDMISRTVGIIVSHPLEVITLRMMAQFVGGETKYNGLIASFVEIYKEDGITGYYAGLIPRLISNAAVFMLVSGSTYVINEYIIRDSEFKAYTASTMRFLATTITYPFLVVSCCMAVNNCGLMAGIPPQMPIYKNWLDCWSHLAEIKQLKRGSTLLWRYYTGPQIIMNGKVIRITKSN